jgi:hypothetical protein
LNGSVSEPSPLERLAYEVVRKVLGVTVEHWDTQAPDRQGQVDAHLHYPDGHQAAFEVTTLGDQKAMQLSSTLERTGFAWPSDAAWWWTITIRDGRDFPRVQRIYREIIARCEAANVESPWGLPAGERRGQNDLHWLLYDSSAEFHGHRDIPNFADDGSLRGVMVTPGGISGSVDRQMTTFAGHLAIALAAPGPANRIAKLLRDPLPERHLYARVEMSGLEFSAFDGLMMAHGIPPEPPPLPADITHLWLMPRFGAHVYLWAPSGWSVHQVIDGTEE